MKKINVLPLLMLVGLNYMANAAEIIQITASNRNLIPKGKSVDAIDGDWIMRNDKVIAVIASAIPGREANMRVQSVQGAVIDFTSLADNNDYLAAFYPQGIPAEDSRRNPGVFANTIEALKSTGGEIVLRSTRNATEKLRYQSVTEYTLKDGESFLRVKTTYINSGKENITITFADKLRMDMDIEDVSPLGKHKLAFMYNRWFNAAYGIYSEKGLVITEKPKLESDPATGLLVAFQDPKTNGTSVVTLAAGERIEAVRYLMYGKDVAQIQRQVASLDKTQLFPITTLKISDTNKKPIDGVYVDVFNKQNELVSFAITNGSGIADLSLPPGDYLFKAGKIGHDTIKSGFIAHSKPGIFPITIQPLTKVTLTVKETGTTRMLPVKVEFKGINGTPDPFLGTTKRAEGSNNQYYSIRNSFEVPIAPGQYLVTFSHGPEYGTAAKELDIKAGESKAISAEIGRLFSSPEWVIADFHNHSTISGDNDADTRSRIINLAGAGIEFGPATEHNRISSYTGMIKQMGLESYLASAAGIELTGPTGVAGGPNHQNAFPLTVKDGKQGGGYPGVSGDVYTQVKGLYDYDKGKGVFLQHNHPGMEMPNLFYDKDHDGVLDKGLGTREFTDAIELQTFVYDILNVTADNSKTKNVPVFYWLQMLNQGDRIFATMTSDSHMIGDRGGLRFVYVYTKKDDPLTIEAYDIAASAKKGHLVMSNGPFLKADINGFFPGDDVKNNPNGLNLNVEVYGNEELEIDRVQVVVNGRQVETLNFTAEKNPEMFTKGALQFKSSISLKLNQDANLIVVATGKKKAQSSNLTTKVVLPPAPIAVTNPFFIDINGDGFIPNKDTLGQPLPTSLRVAR